MVWLYEVFAYDLYPKRVGGLIRRGSGPLLQKNLRKQACTVPKIFCQETSSQLMVKLTDNKIEWVYSKVKAESFVAAR